MFFWLSVIFIYSVFRTGKITYPITYQVFLEECKHAVKEKRFLNTLLTINKFLLVLIEKILMKKILMKKILIKKISMKKKFKKYEYNSNYKKGHH